MVERRHLAQGGFELNLKYSTSTCSIHDRNDRKMVNGSKKIFIVENIEKEFCMEIDYIELDNGKKWIMAGNNFIGPMWLYSQTKERLRTNIISKPEGFVFDITLPKPGKKNKENYTSSKALRDELITLDPEFFAILEEFGAKKIGTREDNLTDTSSRRNYLNVILDNSNCLAPIVSYFLTRIIYLFQVYESLLKQGLVNNELINNVDISSIASRRGKNPEDELESIISSGESHSVEFKPAVWWNQDRSIIDQNYKADTKISLVTDAIVKSVAAFLNSEGGILLIGVSDDTQESYGIKKDIELSHRGDIDGYQLGLNQLLMSSFGNKEIVGLRVKISFPFFQKEQICRIDVGKAYEPIFANTSKNNEEFFIRTGNATLRLSPSSTANYIREHEWYRIEDI